MNAGHSNMEEQASDLELPPLSAYADEPAAELSNDAADIEAANEAASDEEPSAPAQTASGQLSAELQREARELAERAHREADALGKLLAQSAEVPRSNGAAPPWQTPVPPWGATEPVLPLPRGLLPATIERFAFGKPDAFNPAALAGSALATCAIATTDNMRLAVNPTWRECFRVWIALTGSSATAKTPTTNTALRPLVSEQHRRLEEFAVQTEAWLKATGGKKKKKDDSSATDPAQPAAVRYFTHSATIEALTVLEEHTDHGIGLVHDELSALIAAMDGSYKENSANERGHWLALYDGGPHYSDRIMRGATYVKNHSATILGGITTDKLARIVGNSAADGLMSRMSLIAVPAMPPSADLDAMPHETYLEYEELVTRLVRNRPSRPLDVMLATDAREILGQAKQRWQSEAALYVERLPRYAERLGKLTGLAARIALGFTIIEAAEIPGTVGSGPAYLAFDPPRMVKADQMQRACGYVDYQASHDLAFYASAAGEEVSRPLEMARRVAAWLLQHRRQTFRLADLSQGILGWRSFKNTEQFATLELLDGLGWIRPSEGAYFRGVSFVRGTTWAVNPGVHSIFVQQAEAARRTAAEARRRLQAAVEQRKTEGEVTC